MSTTDQSLSDHWIATELDEIASSGFGNITDEAKERALALLDALRPQQLAGTSADEQTANDGRVGWDGLSDAPATLGTCVQSLRDGYVFHVE